MSAADDVAARMQRPQRHRLLQGFPAVPAMVPAVDDDDRSDDRNEERGRDHRRRLLDGSLVRDDEVLEPASVAIDEARGLIVGVIPHTQCIPRVDGCGFCTFPHDVANKRSRAAMIDVVIADIARICGAPGVARRRVDAVYLGGGTANLSSTEQVSAIVAELAAHVDLRGAELTLEGTPQLFAAWFGDHLRNLKKQPVTTTRISMGVQTFDAAQLQRMGREVFGDVATVQKVVRQCRGLGIATSADFLFNLPGQTAAAMDDDVDRAIALGLDQICLYHLVLYEGLGTPWSTDPALVAAMPTNDEACANWLRLRGRLLAAGYVQSTLTNFERAEVAAGPQRFRYEVDSFSPESFDAVGCGPMSLSTVVDWRARTGLKLLRSKNLGARPWSSGDLQFRYDAHSLRALFVVRSLAKAWLSTSTYAQLFGSAFASDFAEAVHALVAAGLLVVDDERVSLTPRGMFFADTVVGALSSTRAARGAGLRTSDLLEERPRTTTYLSMG